MGAVAIHFGELSNGRLIAQYDFMVTSINSTFKKKALYD